MILDPCRWNAKCQFFLCILKVLTYFAILTQCKGLTFFSFIISNTMIIIFFASWVKKLSTHCITVNLLAFYCQFPKIVARMVFQTFFLFPHVAAAHGHNWQREAPTRYESTKSSFRRLGEIDSLVLISLGKSLDPGNFCFSCIRKCQTISMKMHEGFRWWHLFYIIIS